MVDKEKIEEANEIFGKNIVNEVIQLVELFEPDGIYTMFEDEGMEDHVSCIEFLYFE